MHDAHHTSGEESGKYVEGEGVEGGVPLPHQGVLHFQSLKSGLDLGPRFIKVIIMLTCHPTAI